MLWYGKFGIPSRLRLLRRHNQRWITIVILLTLLFCFCCFPWLSDLQYKKDVTECTSDINRLNEALTVMKVHVFSHQYYLNHTKPSIKDSNVDYNNKLLYKSECVEIEAMHTSKPLKMCIYDPSKDTIVSHSIKTKGHWELENVAEMMKALEMFPGISLLDLGSNVGTFTLHAAFRGTQVMAVDALLTNHFLLQRSLTLNNLSCYVTLLHNAIYDKRQTMKVTVNPSNIGGSVVSQIPSFRQGKVSQSQLVDSICLDDLVQLIGGKDVFLKMDLEGTEEAALNCAQNFFTQTNVKVLLIEWMHYRHNEQASASIKSFLLSHHMTPTWGVDKDRVIDMDASHAWPDNVFWMKTLP